MFNPSLPPAICRTTRIVPSLPVTVCVNASAAIASSAKNVFSRKTGNVQVAAAPSMEVRKNLRRVCNVVFISSGQLELRRAHHDVQKPAHRFSPVVRLSRFELLLERVHFVFTRSRLKQAHAQKIDKFLRLI